MPLAVGRTAGAVGGLADSGLMMRLTRGRLWIAALAALLVGIVALNVISLSLSASSSDTARSAEQLTRNGSALRAQLAKELSSQRVHKVAVTLGLIDPEPGAIRYLRPSGDDAAEAARRLRAGELTIAGAPTAPATDVVAPAASAPAPVEAPAESAPAATPETAAPTVDPAAATGAPPGGGGAGGPAAGTGGTGDPSGGGVSPP